MGDIKVLPFYKSYWEALKDLPDTDRLKMYDIIFSFAFTGEEPEVNGLLKSLWLLICPNLEKSIHKTAANMINGQKGGRPLKTEKPTNNPNETQQKPTQKADISLNEEERIKTYGLKTNGLKSETISKKRFCPPTLEEIKTYCEERQNDVDAERFFDYYSANGWVQGKGTPIKDWKACIRTWEKSSFKNVNSQKPTTPQKEIYNFAGW